MLLRMRQGATDREIARSKLMGRKKARQVREIADGRGWLDPAVPLPTDAVLAEVFARQPPSNSVSPLAQHHDAITQWLDQGIQQTTILSLLRRRYGYAGSYSSVRRYVARLRPPSTRATMRLHGTTRQRPLDRFAETERPLLQPLPERAWEPAEWKRLQLARDGHVRFDNACYSAPWIHVGEMLQVKATATMVQIYRGHELVATHTRCESSGEKRTVFDHLPPNAQAYLRQTPQWCREQADAIGPTCRALVDLLLADRVVERLDAARGVVGLAKSYGPARVESACRRALAFDDPRYRTVKTILSRGLDQTALVEDAFDGLCDTYTGAGRFTRDTRNLLSH